MTKNDTMANTSMNVSLPETLKDYVQERVNEGRYSTPSDYVRDLIRADMKRQAGDRLEALLLEGINSGPARPLTEANRAAIRSEGYRRAGREVPPQQL